MVCFNLQCLTEVMSRLYMEKDFYQLNHFMGSYCFNATNTPCWVPQIKDIVDANIQKNLKKCPTIWDYYCELIILHQAGQMATAECIKPCHSSQYRVTLDREIILSGHHGYGETLLSLWFSTNTVTNYKDVLVEIINILHFILCMYIFMQVMDASTIVGSVGGSLGLFLGFSCLATAQAILHKLWLTAASHNAFFN